ncbi:MAG: YigZ family protein [Firmicutes bacterium]|nr:YigZ family protein [Bacillota bacterium]
MNYSAYTTIDHPAAAELTVERSRFIGHCREVASETEAKAFVAQIREEHSQASHNCYAYRIGPIDNPIEYFNDHGEPSGTAGKPILGAIQRLNMTNVVVVVTRYFGGKKLGVRGLIEAYGQTATLVLNEAGSVVRVPKFKAILVYNYSEHSLVLHRLQQVEAEIVNTEYTDLVTLEIAVPVVNEQEFLSVINELPFLKVDIPTKQ